MIDKIKEFFSSYLNHLRDVSYNHSIDRKQFAIKRLTAHREYMNKKRNLNPYLHPETWDD
tara:strand:+ start:812 stop:991 length:180 start_codon:yes stop_codon:yes gene_type:complete